MAQLRFWTTNAGLAKKLIPSQILDHSAWHLLKPGGKKTQETKPPWKGTGMLRLHLGCASGGGGRGKYLTPSPVRWASGRGSENLMYNPMVLTSGSHGQTSAGKKPWLELPDGRKLWLQLGSGQHSKRCEPCGHVNTIQVTGLKQSQPEMSQNVSCCGKRTSRERF